MKKILVAVSLLSISIAVAAQTPETITPEQKKLMEEKLHGELTLAQKQDIREKMKEKWQKMTAEQKAEVRAKVATRIENMTPEQKAAMQEQGSAGPSD